MDLKMWMMLLWALSFTDKSKGIIAEDSTLLTDTHEPPNRQNDKFSGSEYPYGSNKLSELEERLRFGKRCSDRLETALDLIRRRQAAKQKTLHLNGYSLHQQLRTAPYDMYVTDMRVRLPTSSSWVRVDECRFNPQNGSLETRLLFNDLTISGKVNLFGEDALQRAAPADPGADSCSMILRLRRAGIGFHTEPIRRERGQFNVKTDSHFLEPGFISVYAYGCEPKLRQHRRDFGAGNEEDGDDLSREMEDVFLTGIRSLLTSYMQKELQPAIKETLMRNMGYTVSYG